jgi:hypothetical protein
MLLEIYPVSLPPPTTSDINIGDKVTLGFNLNKANHLLEFTISATHFSKTVSLRILKIKINKLTDENVEYIGTLDGKRLYAGASCVQEKIREDNINC